ncbi:MAG: hypothetical protein EAZ12_05525 [Sphingobacteriia bacterium]|nr:MAG: hypothetical protein EAZ12_05525 [Sphingobacteriia bacterium]
MRTFIHLALFILSIEILTAQNVQQNANSNPLEMLMQSSPALKSALLNKDSLRIQIVYTQIDRNKRNKPSFTEFNFNLNNNTYFYPASTVKMPIALLALEKLNELKIKGLTKETTMITDSAAAAQDHVYTQPNAADSRPTIENYIKQIFLVSDNDAYNRLYEFLGQEYIQKKLSAKGYSDAIIRHRLQISRTLEQNATTNPVKFYDTSGALVYEQPMQISNVQYPLLEAKLGKGYMSRGKLVNEPFSFATKNRVYLQDLHHILQSVLFPEQLKKEQRFNLTKEDYAFVRKWMSAFPKESDFPNYDSAHYWDAYCKFLYYGSEKGTKPNNVRIFNKVGDAYGFLIDVTYVVDLTNNIEFMLSAAISCNQDGIYNDDHYDYDTIGFPFMKNLGQALYQHELSRKRKYTPDLKKFQFHQN